MEDNKIISVSPNTQWIGALDPDLKTFDVIMETEYGTTYNSYYINSSKKTIVDTVKINFWDVFYSKLSKLCNPSEIEYIVVNHTEPDHSGSIVKMLEIAPDATIAGSATAIKFLNDIIGYDFKSKILKDEDILDLGNLKLKIVGAPNLHWPDSIYAYLEEDKILFTCDSFGSHYCHPAMYDNQVGNFDDAFKYYYDVILKPFHKFMLNAIEKIKTLEINAICPGHGPLLTTHWKKYVDLSEKYSIEADRILKKNRVFIPYVSAYGYTAELAEKIAEGIHLAGDIETLICNIEEMPLSKIDEYLASSSAFLIGSPTLNQNTLLQIYQLFALINPVRDRTKLAGTFGSFGWSGESAKIVQSVLKNLKLDVFENTLCIKFKPHQKDFSDYINFGKAFGEKFIKKIKNNS
jgi:flavorubredoxin